MKRFIIAAALAASIATPALAERWTVNTDGALWCVTWNDYDETVTALVNDRQAGEVLLRHKLMTGRCEPVAKGTAIIKLKGGWLGWKVAPLSNPGKAMWIAMDKLSQ